MYAVSSSARVYISFFLLFCAAFLFAPTVANANEGYWSTTERRFVTQPEVNRRVQNILERGVKKPPESTFSSGSSSPTYSKNAAGGLSATTESVIKTMGQPSTYSSTINNSVGSAKTALKSCVRSAACAGRALGAGAIIYEGIKGWKEVYDYIYEEEQQQILKRSDEPIIVNNGGGLITVTSGGAEFAVCSNLYHGVDQAISCLTSTRADVTVVSVTHQGNNSIQVELGYSDQPSYFVWARPTLYTSSGFLIEYPYIPFPQTELDSAIDETYEPAVSDAPIVLLSGEPESITLTTPPPADLQSTTTTNTDSNGLTSSSVSNKSVNYSVTNNNTSSPSINYNLVETTTSYDTSGNLTNTVTSTTTTLGVQSNAPPLSDSSPIIDFELPAFCSWASIVCEWIGWTKEELGEEEPDLASLISEFEPDENEFNLGIGSGTCPAPISLNITFIDRTVEVSYQPFCDFVTMIRPFILAAAYLFSAYLYIGVLKRG